MGKSTALDIHGVGFARLEKNLGKLFRTQIAKTIDDAVMQGADDMVFVATEMAPRDTGTLENAIESKRYKPNSLTTNSIIRVRPYDINKKTNRRVHTYMTEAHEEITPAGDKRLGEGSLEKQMSLADGIEVGGHFMTRAYNHTKAAVLERVIKELNDTLSKLS